MTEVLAVSTQSEGSSYFPTSPLRRSASSQTSFLIGNPSSYKRSASKPTYTHTDFENRIPGSVQSSAPSSPPVSHADFSNSSAYSSTSASSLSFDSTYDDDEEDQIVFPSYDDVGYYEDVESPPSPRVHTPKPTMPSTINASKNTSALRPELPEPTIVAEDDTAVRNEPSRHVDYLSHDWKEEDIWYSWRHIVSKRKVYGNSARLENASWRTWTKSMYRLKTISPETLNWLKDCDVTWLYGPLQTGSDKHRTTNSSSPVSRLSRCNSFTSKKPILKKRSMSEIMLQRSISASSLVKQAAAAVQAQQNGAARYGVRDKPGMGRASTSDFIGSTVISTPTSRDTTSAERSVSSSEPETPITGERRHIHFNDKVEQCIAVDCKGDDEEYDSYHAAHHFDNDDSSDDEGVVMMKASKPRSSNRSSTQTSARSSFSGDSKTIAMLPSTTLKYRGDTPDPIGKTSKFTDPWRPGVLSPSPSQETLRPSKPSNNFLLDDDDDDGDADMSWEPSGTLAKRTGGYYGSQERFRNLAEAGNSNDGGNGLRRTPSGMFMPYEEDEDDVVAAGLFGKVVDTVNTAKDIAHVIWNVGWRK
ncbi:MAG: hypothetical protein M1836_001243 [Candelina mexicana]|nr:MAG: hypothetical protein M1836_001243 [Candelina mexicana]